jgi:phosphate acyltransferase
VDLETFGRRPAADAPIRPRVAIDVMGGDHGPAEVVAGALAYARARDDADLIFVGDEAVVRPLIGTDLASHVSIVHAAESVSMDEQPSQAVRRKRDASINVCMRLVRQGTADAVVTAGHTGAGVASAILNLGRLHGVDRPALAVQMITDRGPFVLLDIGATTDSSGLNLAQYARMGTIYAERVLGVDNPSVALLSIGEEGGKGERRVQEASALLSGGDLRFIGNVEGKDLPHHPADVVVCDATVGNVTMKFFEGLSSAIFDLLRAEFRRMPLGPLGYFFMRPGLGRIRRQLDYERLGGAPLLGVKGTVLITHGRARRRMIGFAVGVTVAAAKARIPERIAAALAPTGRSSASDADASAAAHDDAAPDDASADDAGILDDAPGAAVPTESPPVSATADA